MSDINIKDRGVYYQKGDYASLFKRLLVITVDLSVLIGVGYFVSLVWSFWGEPPDFDIIMELGWLSAAIFSPEYFWVMIVISYIYLAIIKRSSVRTIGYRVFGFKITDLNGEKPSLLTMSWRFALLTFGPFHLLIDLLWLGGDENKQSLRDKLANTYMVKANALPAGFGPIIFRRYYFLGLSLLFKEVQRAQ